MNLGLYQIDKPLGGGGSEDEAALNELDSERGKRTCESCDDWECWAL